MAVALTQVITEDRASGGQVIDGSLKFDRDGDDSWLSRSVGASGNRKTFTISQWIKNTQGGPGDGVVSITSKENSGYNNYCFIGEILSGTGKFRFSNAVSGTFGLSLTTEATFRDVSAWGHFLVSVDTTAATDTDRFKFYWNGVEQEFHTTGYSRTFPTQNYDLQINNSSYTHGIGGDPQGTGGSRCYMAEVHFIDGQALGPEYFGFTDPLTNTWRPKKYTGTYGTNGFYLPLDGNSPIGEYKSVNGNDWTPVNFGGSNSIEKATGALPILNTVNGGNVATVGVRTDSDSSSLVLALPLVGSANDVSNQINSGSTTKTITKGNNVDAVTERSNFYGASHRFNGSTDYLDVAASSDFAFGTGDFTVECWIYSGVNSLDNYYRRIYMTDGPTGNATGNFQISITPTSGVINLWENSGQLDVDGTTDVTNSRWNHIAAVRSGTTLKLYVNGVEELSTTYSTSVTANSGSPRPRIGNYDGGTGGGDFDGYMQDLRVYNGVAKYTSNFIPASTNPDILPDTPSGVAGGSALTKITDGAVNFGSGTSANTTDHLNFANINFSTNDLTIEGWFYNRTISNDMNLWGTNNGSGSANPKMVFYINAGNLNLHFQTGSVFILSVDAATYIPPFRWHHIAVTREGGSNWALWIDGNRVSTDSDTRDLSSITADFNIGHFGESFGSKFNGLVSNFRIVNGTALYDYTNTTYTLPTEPLTNVTNTVFLGCQSTTSATTAAVTPGSITANGNAAATNFNPFTTDINAVRGQESGYCILNAAETFNGDGGDIQEGGLKFECPASGDASTRGTIDIPAGFKFYMEARYNEVAGAGGQARLGIAQVQQGYTKSGTGMWSVDFRGSAGTIQKDDEGTVATLTGDPVTGDIVGIKVDLATGEFRAHRNGVYYDSGSALMTGIPNVESYFFAALDGGVNRNDWDDVNFGQKPWKYPPEDGYQPLCLANLPRPTEAAVRPDKYFKTVLYTGISAGTQTISGLNFQPDLVWLKHRESGSSGHIWTDTVRGAGTAFFSNNTSTQDTNAAAGYLSAFNPNGFTLSDGSSNGNRVKNNGSNYVAWCWKAGGDAGTFNVDGVDVGSAAAAGLSGKNITPTACSIGTKQGFSIIKYTGNGSNNQTVPHGLTQAPSFILTKSLNETGSPTVAWGVFHKDGSFNNSMVYLMQTAAKAGDTNVYTTTSQTDEHFTIGTWPGINQDTTNYISYIWHDVPGLQKFGTFEGNGNANGPFVELGFRPAMVIVRGIDSNSRNWLIDDAIRNPYNGKVNTSTFSTNYAVVAANLSAAEPQSSAGTFEGNYIDHLSNGFKLRSTAANSNGSETYIYAAWAEAPTVNLYGGQANAR